MKFFAINGSARPKCNTAKLLDKSLDGIKSIFPNAETERIDLYKIPFNGCKSCFACKKINGRHYGHCVYNDDFKPILDEIVQADGVILGSPVYFNDVTGVMRCFLERFMFPFFVYDEETDSLAPKKMPLAVIYTMNVTKETSYEWGYHELFDKYESYLETVFTKPDNLYVYDTYQFKNYDKYVCTIFDERHKREVRQTQFPKDLENAFELGKRVAIRAEQLD